MQTIAAPSQPLPERVLEVFVAPRRLFERFRVSSPWFGALALATLLAIVVVALQPDDIFLSQVEHAVDRRGRPVTITSSPEEIVRWGRYLGMLGTLLSLPTFAFAIAGILLLLFTVLGRGEGTYPQLLAVTCHALLISGVGAVLTGILQWSFGGPGFQLSPAALLPAGATGPLRSVLAGLDIFALWSILVLGLGASVVGRRPSWPAANALLLGLYLALLVVRATLFA